jgi:hypothetical protein
VFVDKSPAASASGAASAVRPGVRRCLDYPPSCQDVIHWLSVVRRLVNGWISRDSEHGMID